MANFKEKLKTLSYKKLIKAFTLVMGILLIVFMTVANVSFDPENLDFYDWLTNSLVLVGIMVFGLLMGESVGGDKQLEKPNGLYQTNLRDYLETKSIIKDIQIYFSQFFSWFYAKENFNFRVNYLVSKNFDYKLARLLVKYAKFEYLDKLVESDTIIYDGKKEIKLPQLTKEQVDILKDFYDYEYTDKKGRVHKVKSKIFVDAVGYSYYLSAFNRKGSTSILGQSKEYQYEINFNKRFNRAYKIIVSLIVSLIWGMLTVNDFMDAKSAQAWLNLISRITALMTSFTSGWASSVIDVKLRAEMLANKTDVLTFFKSSMDSGDFKPSDEYEWVNDTITVETTLKSPENTILECEEKEQGHEIQENDIQDEVKPEEIRQEENN